MNLNDLWNTYARWDGKHEQGRILEAHKLVETFVNALSEQQYQVTFTQDADVSATAFSDLGRKKITINSSPLWDESLTAEESATILTGMACHEASHTTWSINTLDAVNEAFHYNELAHVVSNVLDDIRIEREFQARYPGFGDLFTPMLAYFGKQGGFREPINPLDAMVRATRYDSFTDWSNTIPEDRDFWHEWAATYAVSEDTHVPGVRVAIKRILANKKQDKPKGNEPGKGIEVGEGGEESGESGEGETGEASKPIESADDGQGEIVHEGGGEGQDEGDGVGEGEGRTEGQSEGDGKGATAGMADDDTPIGDTTGVDTKTSIASCQSDITDILQSHRAQAIIDDARSTLLPSGGRVYESVVENARRVRPLKQDIVNAVEAVLLRGRGGRESWEPEQRSGVLDDGVLTEVAFGNYNVFQQQQAESPRRINLWLLIDTSGSMGTKSDYSPHPITDAKHIVAAIASATRVLPQIKARVYGWSGLGVRLAWESGMNTEYLWGLHADGGTPDGLTMEWAATKIPTDADPVIIMVSDGFGSDIPISLKTAVAGARKKGIKVYGISIGAPEHYMLDAYGKGNYSPQAPTPAHTARTIATLIAKIAQGV